MTGLGRIRQGWLRRVIQIMRVSRVAAYTMLGLAGMASVIYPPASIQQASDGARITQLVWAGVMAVAATFCAWGVARDRWVGEYIGLIPLSLVAAAFAVSALSRGQTGWSGGLFLLGFFGILFSRWQEVALLRFEADREARQRAHRNGSPEPGSGEEARRPAGNTGGSA